MKTYVVEVERTERDYFALTVPALPGLLILGLSIDEVLERARAAIEFYAARTCTIGQGDWRLRSHPQRCRFEFGATEMRAVGRSDPLKVATAL